MRGEFEDSKVCDVRFKHYRRSKSGQASVWGTRVREGSWVLHLDEDADADVDIPEPSSSLLLKQLSMIRRFSSSNRSARLMPGAAMLSSPSGHSPIRRILTGAADGRRREARMAWLLSSNARGTKGRVPDDVAARGQVVVELFSGCNCDKGLRLKVEADALVTVYRNASSMLGTGVALGYMH